MYPYIRLPSWTWPEIATFYDDLTLHVVAGPRSLSYFLPFLLVPLALLIPPSLLSHRALAGVFLPLILGIQLNTWLKHDSYDVISVDQALMAFALIGWHDVRSIFRQLHLRKKGADRSKEADDDVKGSSLRLEEEGYPAGLMRRMRWVGELTLSLRFTDFLIGLPRHDARQRIRAATPRRAILPCFLSTASQVLFNYILLDATSTYVRSGSSPNFARHAPIHPVDPVTTAKDALIFLAHIYAVLCFYIDMSLAGLLVLPFILPFPSLYSHRWLSPLTWPAHFGPLSSVWAPSPQHPTWGLRAFWGTYWHQNLRYLSSAPGLALAHTFRLPNRSTLRYMIIAASGFFFSGAVHAGIVPPQPPKGTHSMLSLRLHMASFFWLQIPGIIVETLVDRLQRRPGRREKEVGPQHADKETLPVRWFWSAGVVVWTTAFLAASAWWTVLPVARQMGWLQVHPIPVSILAWCRGDPNWHFMWQ